MAEIIWTEPALADLEAIAAYIALDKPVAASLFVRRVILRAEQLALFPHSGGKPKELSGTPYRQLVVRPIRIIYRVADSSIYVIHVQRGEQDFRAADLPSRER